MGLPDELLARLTRAYRAAARPDEAVFMARYLRDQFPFLGIKSPQQTALAGEVTKGLPKPSDGELVEVALRCWDLPEREYQYFACGYLRRHVKARPAELLTTVETLVTTKSWWDTVDTLAANVAGSLVAQHAERLANAPSEADYDRIAGEIEDAATAEASTLKASTSYGVLQNSGDRDAYCAAHGSGT